MTRRAWFRRMLLVTPAAALAVPARVDAGERRETVELAFPPGVLLSGSRLVDARRVVLRFEADVKVE